MRVIGLDPGLRRTGWGIIEADGNRLRHVGNGVVTSDSDRDLAARLMQLHQGLDRVLADYRPDEAAVEVSLANRNPATTLKLGMGEASRCLPRRLRPCRWPNTCRWWSRRRWSAQAMPPSSKWP